MERTAAGDELIVSLPLQHDDSTHFGRIASLWTTEFTSTNHARWPKTDFHQAQRIESWLLLQLFTNDAARIYCKSLPPGARHTGCFTRASAAKSKNHARAAALSPFRAFPITAFCYSLRRRGRKLLLAGRVQISSALFVPSPHTPVRRLMSLLSSSARFLVSA